MSILHQNVVQLNVTVNASLRMDVFQALRNFQNDLTLLLVAQSRFGLFRRVVRTAALFKLHQQSGSSLRRDAHSVEIQTVRVMKRLLNVDLALHRLSLVCRRDLLPLLQRHLLALIFAAMKGSGNSYHRYTSAKEPDPSNFSLWMAE